MPTGQRGTGRVAAKIMARVICPDHGNWPTKVARELLQLRFADEDMTRFHRLLAGHYGDTLCRAVRSA